MWRIEQRIERLNDLGFDVEELDIVTDFDGDRVRIQPRVVELGHHSRELQGLTGMYAEDAQARRMLNDIAAYTAAKDLGREDRALVANRWLTDVYEPLMAMVPPEARGKLEPAEIFHELLVHRWYLSERTGRRGQPPRHRPRLHRRPCSPPSPRRRWPHRLAPSDADDTLRDGLAPTRGSRLAGPSTPGCELDVLADHEACRWSAASPAGSRPAGRRGR